MASCSLFEMDNYDGPNASVTGNIIDSKTGENVQMEAIFKMGFGGSISKLQDGFFSVYQLEWDYEKAQYWLIKYNGSYANTEIFAGKYRLDASSNNFYPVIKDNVEFKKGDNTLDWEVVPYARIIDPKIEYVNGKFVATFKCEYGDDTKANKIVDAKFMCYPDTFVGTQCNYCSSDPGATSKKIVADGKTVNTLTIDPTLPANISEFKYDNRTHYFRIAVCAQANGYNSGKHYNYSPTVSIKL